MRNSRTRTCIRPWRAGVAVVATTAAVVAGLASPAFAAVDISLDVNTGPVGGGNTVVATGTGLLTGVTAPGARFVPGATTACPATYSTALTGSLSATATKGGDDNTANIVVPAVVLGTNYGVCVYAGTGTGSLPLGKTTSGQAYAAAAAAPAVSPNAAAPATTTSPVTVTATGIGPFLTGVATAATIFTTAASCPATYSATSAITATTTKNATNTVATVTVPTTLTAGMTYNVCIYAGTTNLSALVGSGQYSVVPAVSLSPNVGPSGGNNTLVVSSTTNTFLSGVTAPGVLFTRGTCPNTYVAGTGIVAAVSPTKINTSRLSVKVPVGVALAGSEGSAVYKTCVYNGATIGTSTLIAQPLTYSIAAAVTLISVTPSSGPSQGGQEVTIAGTNFPTAADAVLTVAIGGSPLTNPKVNGAGTAITGTTTAHSPSSSTVTVTTLSGSKVGLSYAYTYGITITPTTAPQAATAGVTTDNPTIDIQGAGFSDLTPGDDADDTAAATGGATIFLVDNSWFTTTAKPFNAGLVTQCTGLTVIADNELICSLDLSNTLLATGLVDGTPTKVAKGTYSIVIYNDVAVTNLTTPAATLDIDYSRISGGSTFTVSDY
jgi:IPT/TIG domain-containing protein